MQYFRCRVDARRLRGKPKPASSMKRGGLGYAGARIGAWFTNALTWGSTLKTGVSASPVAEVVPGQLEDLGMGVQGAARATPTAPIDPNRLNHIFNNSEHAFDDLVEQFGSQTAAFNAVEEAAQEAFESGQLTVNANGALPSGDAGSNINVIGKIAKLIGGSILQFFFQNQFAL